MEGCGSAPLPFHQIRIVGFKMQIKPFNSGQNGIAKHVIQNAISGHGVQNVNSTIQ
jgi:hypothetical protein